MKQEITIRQMVHGDWESVRAIYWEGLATGNATFETEKPSWEKWNDTHLDVPRLVAHSSATDILGWAALSPVSSRLAYRGVAEVSVYVTKNFRGIGIGKELLKKLVAESELEGIWTLQASVFPENVVSLTTLKFCGFVKVGVRQRIGRLHGRWRDTVLLERRSEIVGND